MPKLIAAISGTATMAIQMCVVRMVAPWFGSSSLVWATVIGLSLLAMSSGYGIGGRLADRSPDPKVLIASLSGAAVWIAVASFVATPVLSHADFGIADATWSTLVGTAVSVGVLFFAPALLLGITLPFLSRFVLASVTSSGASTGRIYAVSTVGSIVGTLFTALILLQWLGTRRTLWAIALLLVLGAVLAIRLSKHNAAVAQTPAVGPQEQHIAVLALPTAMTIVVVEGMATMATEMTVARLIAPFYGTSQVVWAIIIAIVMGCIAFGAWMGGRMADRRPTLAALIKLLSATGVAIALLPILSDPVMRLSTGGIENVDIAVVLGTFLAAMVLLCVPVTLLGMIPPWVIRLAVPDVAHGGRTVGRLYALSTAGALVGTFASALWLIPTIGSRSTMVLVASLLVVATAAVSVRRAPSLLPIGAVILVVVLLFVPTGTIKPIDNAIVLDERDSRYQYIQVIESANGTRQLSLNEGWATHSIYRANTVLTGQYWDNFLVAGDLLDRPTKSMLIVGNAAGTTARAFGVVHPDVKIDGVEVDQEVSNVGRKYFGMNKANLSVTTADGRPFLQHADGKKWDLIQVDAFRQPYIPFHLTTQEFFGLTKERMTPGGVLAINVGTTPGNYQVSNAIAATMRKVFPLVIRYRAEEYNDILVAVNDPKATADDLKNRASDKAFTVGRDPQMVDNLVNTEDLADIYADFANGITEVDPGSARILTDDHAPVEWMTDKMILHAAEGQ